MKYRSLNRIFAGSALLTIPSTLAFGFGGALALEGVEGAAAVGSWGMLGMVASAAGMGLSHIAMRHKLEPYCNPIENIDSQQTLDTD
ncbi:MAG: hypothetical protein FWE31_00700 [Firmicutes bacterium]|nr:hypothetical protein [Bacillota bacterium]